MKIQTILNIIAACLTTVCLAGACRSRSDAGQYYVRSVVFPEGATPQEKIDMAAHVVPSEQQLEWQKSSMIASVHFGMGTFTGQESGTGNEPESIFNPDSLSCEQWVRTFKLAGFRMVMLTAKCPDGFCLWATRYTTYSVLNSSWGKGFGDVVQMLQSACQKYGMRFGIYLSVNDRNSKYYGTSRYGQYFLGQLRELLNNYGEIDEVYIDWKGSQSQDNLIDLASCINVVHSLQHSAVIGGAGDDFLPGDVDSLGHPTEWSVKVSADSASWYPSEVKSSIRPGLFYHKSEDSRIKTLEELVDIYFRSVGMNSVLSLNVPPDSHGLICKTDSLRLMEFAEYIHRTFKTDFIENGDVPVVLKMKSHGTDAASVCEYQLKAGSTINVVMLKEDITKGQRVEKFSVDALVGGNWQKVADGTTIGFKRLLRFPQVQASRIRLTVLDARADANLVKVGAYFAEDISR